jgi:ferredoxin
MVAVTQRRCAPPPHDVRCLLGRIGPYAAAMAIDERSCIRCGICVDWCPTECPTMDHFRLTPADARDRVDLGIVSVR